MVDSVRGAISSLVSWVVLRYKGFFDAFLSLNLTSERCFSTTLVGYPLFRRRFSKFFIFSSKVNCEEFVLRSLNASPLVKPFVTPGG